MVAPSIFGLLGLFLPFAFLFDRNTLDTQINTRADLEKMLPTIPVATEIPHIKNKKAFKDIPFVHTVIHILGFLRKSDLEVVEFRELDLVGHEQDRANPRMGCTT